MADKKPLVLYGGIRRELAATDYLELFGLKLINAAGTFINVFSNATTAARTWTLPDATGTIALTSDIPTDVRDQADYSQTFLLMG